MVRTPHLLPRGQRNIFDKQETVCSHIYLAFENNEKNIPVYPLCIQIFEDGYNVFWYCDKCVENFSLSTSGVYVFDAGDEFDKIVAKLDNVKICDDVNCEPFNNFVKKECDHSIRKENFIIFSKGFVENPVASIKNITKIPFGVQPKK